MKRQIDNPDQILVSLTFEPYVPGGGPIFALTLSDTGKRDEYGKHIFRYKLSMTNPEQISEDCIRPPQTQTLFEGEDYHAHYTPAHPQGLHNLDSVIEGIMGFLTLKPGDTDPDWFKNYTPEQLEYCEQYADSLMCEVQARYGDH